MTLAVVILAGGKGRRIGGSKPLRSLAGKRLIDHAERFARSWSTVAAVAVRNPRQVEPIGLECICDDARVEGPLAGLAAALRFARERECAWLLTIPADMPFLPGDLAERLSAASGQGGAVIAESGGKLHPVCALWSIAALASLPGYLATGRRSLKGIAQAVGMTSVEWPIDPLDPFLNINSAEDLAAAERLIRR